MNKDPLEGLNPPQMEAVCHIRGPLLVLAGAGSGKTKVITHRIAYLVAKQVVDADQILGVTFTNKAANEMKQRVINLLGPAGHLVTLCTFHSFCARLLRQHVPLIGYNRKFSIYDEADSLALIKRIIKSLGIPENQPSPESALNLISQAKDRLISADTFLKTSDDYIKQNTARIYAEYQHQLKQNNALDFDDLLFTTVILFEKFPHLLSQYQKKFPYLLVDEYQDTNYAQYQLVMLLGSKNKNICVVGDDDQSIYGWRGADINNILNFETDFPDCKVIKLEQNYRSTKTILDAAHGIVIKNENRKPKKLFTVRPGGDKITLMLCGDDREEAGAIVDKIKFGLSSGKKLTDHAILYRTHAQSRALEDALRDAGIPYVIVGGLRFYDRLEIKDIIAYLRLLVNPDDTGSLLRIINKPKRGVGKKTIEKILNQAVKTGVPAFEVLSKPEDAGIKGKSAAELTKFYKTLKNLSVEVNELTPDEIAIRLVKQIGYVKMLQQENSAEADVRIDNIGELINGIIVYMEKVKEEHEDRQPTLQGFLEEVSLITDVDIWNEDDEAVVLMTLHSAKGLEFDIVFMTGMEQGLFPLLRNSLGHSLVKDMEEERRLCYVGITRAKSKLHLSMAGYRRRFDGPNITRPSEFLMDIPENLVDVERYSYYNTSFAGKNLSLSNSRLSRRDKHQSTTDRLRQSNTYQNEIYHNDEEALDRLLQVGMMISHSKFGVGKIIDKEGNGEDMILTIRFGSDVKRIMPKYVGLEVLGYN